MYASLTLFNIIEFSDVYQETIQEYCTVNTEIKYKIGIVNRGDIFKLLNFFLQSELKTIKCYVLGFHGKNGFKNLEKSHTG